MIVRDDVLYEGIVSFKTHDGYYATPMGFRVRNYSVYLKVYHGTQTYSYLSSIPRIVLNVVEDPYVYLHLAFKKETNGLAKVRFIEIDDNTPIIDGAKAYAVLLLKSISRGSVYDIFEYFFNGFIYRDHVDEPFSRCRSLAIEALIYLTKIKTPDIPLSERRLAEAYLDHVVSILESRCIDPFHGELVRNIVELYSRVRISH